MIVKLRIFVCLTSSSCQHQKKYKEKTIYMDTDLKVLINH